MRLTRFAVGLGLLVAIGAFIPRQVPASGGAGLNGGTANGPCLQVTVDHTSGMLHLVASSSVDPQIPALINIIITFPATQQQFAILDTFNFDALGHLEVNVPLSTFMFGTDIAVTCEIGTLGPNNTIDRSMVWGLLVDHYVIGDPQNPPPAGYPSGPEGGRVELPLPGTEAPLLPHTWSVIPGQGFGETPVYNLTLFGCAPGGPAGSFPIN